jgi:ornithine cyclodeaminase/alanine dehydrogenase
VSLLGSGAEAHAQLDAMRAAGLVKSARVYSPTEANRKRLAAAFRQQHGLDVVDVPSAQAAVDGSDIVLAAVKSSTTVLEGRWLRPGMHINSVGTARRDQREIDIETFKRSDVIVVDTREGVFSEAGDAYAARDAVSTDEVNELSAVVIGAAPGRTSDQQITLFKSVGTGIQDIALAAVIYERARERRIGADIGTFPYLKET